jgi:hypothetical protein
MLPYPRQGRAGQVKADWQAAEDADRCLLHPCAPLAEVCSTSGRQVCRSWEKAQLQCTNPTIRSHLPPHTRSLSLPLSVFLSHTHPQPRHPSTHANMPVAGSMVTTPGAPSSPRPPCRTSLALSPAAAAEPAPAAAPSSPSPLPMPPPSAPLLVTPPPPSRSRLSTGSRRDGGADRSAR